MILDIILIVELYKYKHLFISLYHDHFTRYKDIIKYIMLYTIIYVYLVIIKFSANEHFI